MFSHSVFVFLLYRCLCCGHEQPEFSVGRWALVASCGGLCASVPVFHLRERYCSPYVQSRSYFNHMCLIDYLACLRAFLAVLACDRLQMNWIKRHDGIACTGLVFVCDESLSLYVVFDSTVVTLSNSSCSAARLIAFADRMLVRRIIGVPCVFELCEVTSIDVAAVGQ